MENLGKGPRRVPAIFQPEKPGANFREPSPRLKTTTTDLSQHPLAIGAPVLGLRL